MKHALLALTLDIRGQAQTQSLPYTGVNSTSDFFYRVISALMAVAAVSVLLFLLWGAFDWINSNGEKGKIESARNKMSGAVTGFVVLAAVFAIFLFIQDAFGIKILQFTP